MRCSVSVAKLMVMFKSEHTASIYRFVQNLRFSQRATSSFELLMTSEASAWLYIDVVILFAA